MHSWAPSRVAIALAVLSAATLLAQDATLVVDGKPLITPQPPTRLGGEMFAPLAPIARALGATVSVSPDQTVRVRRADGGMVTFDARTGEIRSGAVLVGQVANFRLIRISSEIDQLLFPLTAIVPLLGVNVRMDDGARVIYLDSLPGGAPLPTGSGGLRMTDLGYNYNMTTTGQIFGQNANVRAQALAGAATLSGLVQLTRVPNGPFLYLNQASLRADLSPTRAVIIGDQAVYSGVDALTNSLRGFGYEQKVKGFTAYVYGGKAVGTTAASFGSSIPRYDTELVGATLRTSSLVQSFSVALNAFKNSQRKGTSIGVGFSRRFTIDQFNIQAVGGVFSGLSLHVAPLDQVKAQVAAANQDNTAAALLGTATPAPSYDMSQFIAVHGPGYGFSASNAFLPVKQVTISGQVDYYSQNFLTAREDTRFNGATAETVSVSVRPFRLLTLNASAGNREYLLGDVRKTRTYTMGGTLVLPGRKSPQLGYMRTLQLDESSTMGRFELEQCSIMLPSLDRYSASLFYTETTLGPTRVRDVNGLLGIELHRAGRFDLHYQSQFHNNRRYGGEWSYRFGERDGFLRLGMDTMRTYGAGSGQSGLLPLVGLRLPLPHRQVLEITYMRDVSTQILQLQLGGKLITPHEILRDSRGNPRINLRTNISGVVYKDLNYNGTFDGADQGIADVQVWLDDRTMIATDARGYFRFENIDPGAHALRAELGTVPAGFVFATLGNQTVAAVPNRENRVEFRVIRTGQITGKVTYLDYSEDPDHPVEKPLADARIVVTGDGDTYSEANGVFLIGDLPPGRYELRLDLTSVPRGYVPQPSSVTVTVTPGGVSRDTVFKLAIPPRPVIEIKAPDQKIEVPEIGAATVKER